MPDLPRPCNSGFVAPAVSTQSSQGAEQRRGTLLTSGSQRPVARRRSGAKRGATGLQHL
jgi:hypothetical protein